MIYPNLSTVMELGMAHNFKGSQLDKFHRSMVKSLNTGSN